METFKTIEDVEEWLAPMNYEEFWIAIKPWCLPMPYTRERCDADIAGGAAIEDVKLGLKMIACRLFTKRHGLKLRPAGPVLRVVSLQD